MAVGPDYSDDKCWDDGPPEWLSVILGIAFPYLAILAMRNEQPKSTNEISCGRRAAI